MMRPYQPKDNVQAKSYYTDRFWVAPSVPREKVTDEDFAAVLEKASAAFTILESFVERDQLVLVVNPEENKPLLQLLKENGYTMLSEMSAVDFLAQRGGFEIFYQLLNVDLAKRIRVKCFIAEKQAIESVEPLFRSADWSEREMFDMFGIKVNNHPYLKRILMPDDWEGYPLLKTYPLHGDEFAQWYEVDKIFGKEARELIGPELRDAAMIDAADSKNFARLGHEVGFGENPTSEAAGSITKFNEDALLVEKFDTSKENIVERR